MHAYSDPIARLTTNLPRNRCDARKNGRAFASFGIALLLLAQSFAIEAASNKKPKANPGKSQTVNEQTLVTLDGSGSVDADGTIASYLWEQTSGDSVTLTGANSARASFTAPLVKKASKLAFKLTVTDNAGATANKPLSVQVKPVNTPPVANAGGNQSILVGAAVALNGSASSDTDGQIVKYQWKQTAGTKVKLTNANTATPGFTAPSALKAGAESEALAFTVTVTDDEKASSTSAPITVNVVSTAAAVLQGSLTLDKSSLAAGETVNASGDVSGGKSPYTLVLAWGDGSQASALPANHSYTAAGTYNVTLTVTDANGASKSVSKSLLVTAPALSATLELNKNKLTKGGTVTATSSAKGGKAAYSFSVNWGDGSNPSTGASATHNYTQIGSYTVTLTVTDADGTHKTATQNVTVEAEPLAAKFDLNGSTPTILAGDTLTARAFEISGGSGPYKVTFEWGDGSAAQTFSLAAGEVNKAASHPYANLGNYTLKVTVTDADKSTKTYTITVDAQAANPLGQC